MGQQPNIELNISDLPRPVAHPAAARRWRPARPGDLAGPGDLPSGASYGTTGPDGGYALRLAAGLDLLTGVGESVRAARGAVAALGSSRAAAFGRAPTPKDVEAGALILGYTQEGPGSVSERAARRRPLIANIDHSTARARELVGVVANGALVADIAEIRTRLAAGEYLFG